MGHRRRSAGFDRLAKGIPAQVANGQMSGLRRLAARDIITDPQLLDLARRRGERLQDRRLAIWVLGYRAPARSRRGLVELLASERLRPLVMEAGTALSKRPLGNTTDVVCGVLQRAPEPWRRGAAAYALRRSRKPDSELHLMRAAGNSTESIGVRALAIETLGVLRSRRAIPTLRRLLNHKSAQLRLWSAYSLGQLRSRAALPELEKLTLDRAKVRGLGTVADEARDAIARIMGASGG